jgi:heterotetrameric sarcosine oxidase gamma subunit
MNESALVITRLAPRYVSLLQIHGSDSVELAPLIVGILGFPDVQHEGAADSRVYSIGPSEWLLIDYRLDGMRRRLSADLGRALVRLTDVSAAFTSLRIEGVGARTVLGSDIDAPWAAAISRPGQYARTRLGQIEVILHCTGAQSFELHVDRSVADHLEAWLTAQHETHTARHVDLQ